MNLDVCFFHSEDSFNRQIQQYPDGGNSNMLYSHPDPRKDDSQFDFCICFKKGWNQPPTKKKKPPVVVEKQHS